MDPMHPDDRERVSYMIRHALETHEPFNFDYRTVVDGEMRWMHTRAEILPDSIGKAIRLRGTTQDITERKHLEDQMFSSQKLADLGTLAAGVAHEMNSPLQVITGVSESLLRKSEAGKLEQEKLKHDLDVIHRNGWRCAEIVRSLHTYARASGSSLQSTDLNELVRDLLLLIEHQLKSWASISVTTELTLDLPPLTCDRNQITQVLINLLTNARMPCLRVGKLQLARAMIHRRVS